MALARRATVFRTASKSTSFFCYRRVKSRTAGRTVYTAPSFLASTSSLQDPKLEEKFATTSRLSPTLQKKLVKFVKDVETFLPADGKGVAIATAWLNTDNLIVALLAKLFPHVWEGVSLVAVDTLHLFPETLALAEDIQMTYAKTAIVTKPLKVNSRSEFESLYGKAQETSAAEFEYHSKVEPFQRGLELAQKQISITGRRADQGNQRQVLDVWEEDKKTFNPLADWSWEEVTEMVDLLNIPYNLKHSIVYVASESIPATERHKTGLPWKEVSLGKPYWQASPLELSSLVSGPTEVVYVWKSFGDVHTSVPVLPNESERAGRFVRLNKTECGIHTRATVAKGQPHGGVLVDLFETDPRKIEQEIASTNEKSLEIDERTACDLELLMNGGFSPLRGFMTEKEYNSVVENMRLPELQLWGIPIVLHTNDESIKEGDKVLLKYRNDVDHSLQPLAVLTVTSKWIPDKVNEAQKVFGTTRLDHPGVKEIALERGKYYVGGPVVGFEHPKRKDIPIQTPREVRNILPKGKEIVAFQCRNPIHRAHFELFTRVPNQIDNSVVLVHPTCGPTQDGDIDWRLRFLTYEALQEHKPNPSIFWAYLPYSMHMGGPKEAIQHMIIRKNFGATQFIIGRDMAGCKSSITGEDFYGPYDAQDFAKKYEKELGVKVVPFKQLVYTEERGFIDEDEAKECNLTALKLSGTEFRKRLKNGAEIPDWFSFAPVVQILRESMKKSESE